MKKILLILFICFAPLISQGQSVKSIIDTSTTATKIIYRVEMVRQVGILDTLISMNYTGYIYIVTPTDTILALKEKRQPVANFKEEPGLKAAFYTLTQKNAIEAYIKKDFKQFIEQWLSN